MRCSKCLGEVSFSQPAARWPEGQWHTNDASASVRCSVVGGALFHEPIVDAACGGLVIVRDIDFASTSEATLLPFYGRCHLGYLPSQGVVLGLSKVARLVTMLAKRLQAQERFTHELLAAFDSEVLSQVSYLPKHARNMVQYHAGPVLHAA